MRDPNDDDIDRAYRAAVDATEDGAAALRRRAAVLKAVRGPGCDASDREGSPGAPQTTTSHERPASNDSRWHLSATWWRGVAAACVIASSALLVVHLHEEPGVTTEPRISADAARGAPAVPFSPATKPPAATPAHETTVVGVPEETSRPSAGAPSPAIATGTAQRPPVVSRKDSNGVPSIAEAVPAVNAARSAFSGDDSRAANAIGRVGGVGADTAAQEAERSPSTTEPATPAPAPALSQVGQPGPSGLRTEQPLAAGTGALAGTAVPHASAEPDRAAGSLAKATPQRAARPADDAVQASRSSSLLAAVTRGDIRSARLILRTTDPDTERDADGRTALAVAVLRSDLPLAKLLLASGANRHAQDRFGQSPQDYAEASGDQEMRQAFAGH
jgi:hypothetical protein